MELLVQTGSLVESYLILVYSSVYFRKLWRTAGSRRVQQVRAVAHMPFMLVVTT